MKKKISDLKIDNKKELQKLKQSASGFKSFISRGNVVDMAVGVIIGGAFGKIVTSLVNDIIMPVIGVVLGGLNFSDLSIKVGKANVAYGMFIQTIIDFLIISFCIYMMIKLFDRFKKKEEIKEESVTKKSDEVLLLEEIRDLLKKQNSK